MPTFMELKDRYPELQEIRGYVFFHTSSVHLDGHFPTDQLRFIAEFVDKYNKDFEEWYLKCRQVEPKLYEEACNAFYHDFAKGKTPEQSVKDSGHYGMKKE